MTCTEFLEKLKMNQDGQLITKGTEFDVFDEENHKIGVIAVQRTTVVFLDINPIPADLWYGKYTFAERKDD